MLYGQSSIILTYDHWPQPNPYNPNSKSKPYSGVDVLDVGAGARGGVEVPGRQCPTFPADGPSSQAAAAAAAAEWERWQNCITSVADERRQLRYIARHVTWCEIPARPDHIVTHDYVYCPVVRLLWCLARLHAVGFERGFGDRTKDICRPNICLPLTRTPSITRLF